MICLPRLHNNSSPIPGPLFDNGNDPAAYQTSDSTTLCPNSATVSAISVSLLLEINLVLWPKLPQTTHIQNHSTDKGDGQILLCGFCP